MRDTSLGYYKALLPQLAPLPGWQARAQHAANALLARKQVYNDVLSGSYIPWEFCALLHKMECDCDFSQQILNGEPWNQKTTQEPKGLGPWDSWAASTREALDKYWDVLDLSWSDADILRRLELYNGRGYALRYKHSPYIVNGSALGVGIGKFTSDGHYDPKAVSQQVGAGVILWVLRNQQPAG